MRRKASTTICTTASSRRHKRYLEKRTADLCRACDFEACALRSLIFERCTTEEVKLSGAGSLLKTRTDGRRRGLKTEWSLEKLLKRVPKVQCSDAESLRQKDRVKKDTEEKQPRNKKSGAQKRKNSGSAVFCCIFQSEPCSAGKIPQEMVFFFSKRCGCVIHIVQTIRRMEREKRKWMH